MIFSSTCRAVLILCLAASEVAGCNAQQDIAAELLEEQEIAPGAGPPSSAVHFALGSARLTREARSTIRAAAISAKERNVTHIRVVGYADALGSAAGNERLSRRRAQAVAAELVANGVLRDRITIDWHGERELPVPTPDGTPKAQNRVVTIGL